MFISFPVKLSGLRSRDESKDKVLDEGGQGCEAWVSKTQGITKNSTSSRICKEMTEPGAGLLACENT